MIKLEQFTKTDFKRLVSWIDNEEKLIQFAGPVFNFPLTEDQLEKYLENKNTNAFKVIETTSNQTIGHCEIYLAEASAKIFRILIGEKFFRGKGLGLEVVNLLLEKCSKDFSSSLVELNVYDWNIGAIKCYEKAGFVVNSEKSKTITVKGNVWNSINMTLAKKDWTNLHYN
jgi:RimJ/RimL family protein N-acetyltransferase